MSLRLAAVIALAVLLVAGVGVGGYFLGESEAPTAAEATDARETAHAEASEAAEAEAAEASRERGVQEGLGEGEERGEREGREAGTEAGEAAAGQELAAIEAEEAQAAAPAQEPVTDAAVRDASSTGSGLEYTDELPHGEPGYLLPEEERSLSCIGVDANTGECIGD